MKIYVVKDYEAMSVKAADILTSQTILKPDSVLGLATGSTPVGMYEELINNYQEGRVDFSNVTTFNLDEYLGLEQDHDQSYYYFMHENLFNDVNIAEQNINLPSGVADDLAQEGESYDQKIDQAGGIDLQILGIGSNGHVGFNEPDEELNFGTGIVDLTESTIKANSRFFDCEDEVPKQAISMGMGSIMKAKKILLLASGEHKAEAIKRTVNAKITTDLPASLLQLHPDVTIVVDEAAAKYL